MRKRTPIKLPQRVLRRFFDEEPAFPEPEIELIGPGKDDAARL